MTGENELPEGWVSVIFPGVCIINPQKPPRNSVPFDTIVTFVPMHAVDAEKGAIIDSEIRKFGEVRDGFTFFQEGDVIFAKITPCMENGKAAIARNLMNGMGFGSTEFFILRSNGSVIPEYIYHYIRQESFRKNAEENMTGSVGQKRVPKSFIENSIIPLPPLAEQRRIVAAVEALLACVNASRERLERVQGLLKAFRQAVLAAACSGRLTEGWRADYKRLTSPQIGHIKFPDITELHQFEIPKSWTWTSIGNLVHYVQYGISIKADADEKTGIPILRMGNIQDVLLNFDDLKYIQATKEELSQFYLEKGDVLFNRTNSPELVGKSAVFDIDEKMTFASYLIRIKVNQDLLLPKYLNYWINSNWGREWAQKVRTDGVSQSNINAKKLQQMYIPLPPLAEQHEIVRRVEALFALADRIKQRVAAGKERADRLTQAILAKAFRGELVPTEAELARREGRSYEPASVLLERIKLEKKKFGSK